MAQRPPYSQRPSPDDRTLVLSGPQLTNELLEAFIAFAQRLAAVPTVEDRAAIHAEALKAAGLDARIEGPVTAMVRDFSGRRKVLRRLQKRRAELAATAAPDRLQKIDQEIARAEDTRALRSRYGDDNIAMLIAREEELLELHSRLYQ